MLVKCEKCGQGYEVDASRLSPQGARIKCPTCTHIFLVRPQNAQMSTPAMPAVTSKPAPAPVSETPSKPQQEETTWRIRHIGLTYQFHDLDSLRDWLSARGSLDDVKIAKGDDEWGELGDYSEVLTTELITKFFPLGDVPTSKKGTSNINNAVSNTDSRPAANPDLGGLRSISSLGPIAMSPMSISSDLSTAVESGARNSRQARQEQKKAEAAKKRLKKRYIVFGALFIFLLLVLIVVLRINLNGGLSLPFVSQNEPETAPVEDVEGMKENIEMMRKTDPLLDDVKKSKAEKGETPEQQEETIVTDEELAKMADEDMKKRLNEARQMVKEKKWPEALATLLSLVNDNPMDTEALELLAKTYRALNQPEKAAEIDAQIKKVKSMADDIVIGE